MIVKAFVTKIIIEQYPKKSLQIKALISRVNYLKISLNF